MPNAKCEGCGKTVYPLEAVSVLTLSWHKGCFKCQEEGCSLQLTLKTCNADSKSNKVYCAKHAPKNKPIATTVDMSMSLSNAKNAPKVSVVSNEQRGGDEMRKPIQVTVNQSMTLSNAKNAPKVNLVSNEKRGTGDVPISVLDMAHTNAKNAPKVSTVNEQVRGEMAGAKNTQEMDMTTSNAMKAPKVSLHNSEVRLQSNRGPDAPAAVNASNNHDDDDNDNVVAEEVPSEQQKSQTEEDGAVVAEAAEENDED